ncbi:hypothetical protein FIV00_13720 [Labrenzia sp. THAF82]|nr:hypothetical protein FIV00_13720 [Labrenzia sp. THAF82]
MIYRLFISLLSALTVTLAVNSTTVRAEIMPLNGEQNLAVIAYFMPENYSGNSEFEQCARLWRVNKNADFCEEYYSEIVAFAEERAGSLSKGLLFRMIDFYLGSIDRLDASCRVYSTEENLIRCGQERAKLRKKLLKDFINDSRSQTRGQD